MTEWGVTPQGFVAKTFDDVKTETDDALRAAFGQSIDLSAQSVFGQLSAPLVDRVAELWDVAQAIYTGGDPDDASDDQLDNVCAITGTIRDGSRASTVTMTATGAPGTTLLAGRVASVVVTGTKFQTDADATLAAVSAWVTFTPYTLGNRVTNGGSVYQCTTAGTSVGGPLGVGAGIVDGTCVWLYLGQGTAAVDTLATAQDEGPFNALGGSLTVIETPVAGWQSVFNVLDGELGADVESDPLLRLRREDELAGESDATVNAIRQKVLRVGDGTNDPVTSCTVFQNTTMAVNGDGLPPKSVEVLVQGGDEQEILDAIFNSVDAGIETFGGLSGVVTDDAGNDHDVYYSRPTEALVYVVVTIIGLPDEFPDDGADQIKARIVSAGNLYPVGKNVTSSAVASRCWLPGVLDVPLPFIGVAPAPATTTTIVCGNRDLARWDSTRITVILVPGSL